MQISRLLEIVYLLLERGSVTASELAERFEVSVRTVYRDMDALGEAGIPVCAERGRQGGFRLMENFSLDRSLLSKREQDEILFALQTLNATSAAECGQLLSRLSGLFRRDCTDWIEVDFSDWGNEKEQRERFEQVKSAILERRVIRFTYYGSDGEKSERKAEPLRLLFKGSWYLQAFCLTRQDFRTFRLSRMEHVSVTSEAFEKRALGPPPVEMAASDAPVLELLLRFSPRAAFRVYDEFPPDRVEKQKDGGFLVRASFPEGGWVYGYLLSFGEDAEVLAPERMRRILLEKAERMRKIYQSPVNMT